MKKNKQIIKSRQEHDLTWFCGLGGACFSASFTICFSLIVRPRFLSATNGTAFVQCNRTVYSTGHRYPSGTDESTDVVVSQLLRPGRRGTETEGCCASNLAMCGQPSSTRAVHEGRPRSDCRGWLYRRLIAVRDETVSRRPCIRMQRDTGRGLSNNNNTVQTNIVIVVVISMRRLLYCRACAPSAACDPSSSSCTRPNALWRRARRDR